MCDLARDYIRLFHRKASINEMLNHPFANPALSHLHMDAERALQRSIWKDRPRWSPFFLCSVLNLS
jgi:hypothetical protein